MQLSNRKKVECYIFKKKEVENERENKNSLKTKKKITDNVNVESRIGKHCEKRTLHNCCSSTSKP